MKESLIRQLDMVLVELCEKGVYEGVFPGAVTAVFIKKKGERKRVIQAVGKTRIGDTAGRVTKETFFDLASLTKPLATTLSILCLIEQGVVKLEDSLDALLESKIGPDKKNIKLEELLSHSSGFSPYRPYFELFKPEVRFNNKKKIIKRILNDPLEYEPGTECRYSDLGFILLGKIIEIKSGHSLDRFYQENITAPLGLEEKLFFLPLPEVQKKNNEKFA
ncbi:MAG: serine hydrolase, partial [Desulfobulbaceae bacterium]|nr:serine hydrolase [Desulfobulbaceae bacterium]